MFSKEEIISECRKRSKPIIKCKKCPAWNICILEFKGGELKFYEKRCSYCGQANYSTEPGDRCIFCGQHIGNVSN